jgi:hypothetical protein
MRAFITLDQDPESRSHQLNALEEDVQANICNNEGGELHLHRPGYISKSIRKRMFGSRITRRAAQVELVGYTPEDIAIQEAETLSIEAGRNESDANSPIFYILPEQRPRSWAIQDIHLDTLQTIGEAIIEQESI